MSYCPNCSAQLLRLDVDECWNCHAEFSALGSWNPVSVPPGEFKLLPQRATPVHKELADERVWKAAEGVVTTAKYGCFVAIGLLALLALLIAALVVLDPCIICK